MTISAQIICDSISRQNIRLTTMQLRYPRFIHAEELTHRRLNTSPEYIDSIPPADDDSYFVKIPDGLMYDRNLSRNASSSRAVPIKRLIEDLRRDPAIPIHWGKHQAGMQAWEEHDALVSIPTWSGGIRDVDAHHAWLEAMEHMIAFAEAYAEAGYHKQFVNRLLETFSHINVVVTATEWSNFYALRRHPDAQPEIKALADAMWDAQQASNPSRLMATEWHLPYVREDDYIAAREFCQRGRITRDMPSREEILGIVKKVSIARCARVSYLTHDGRQTSVEEDVRLADKLIAAVPLHASPAEHQATPDIPVYGTWEHLEEHGNLVGWIQNRKTLAYESM